MKIAFKIPPHAGKKASLHLLAEAGEDEVSFLMYEKQPFVAHGFYTFNFDRHLNVSELRERIESIFGEKDILSREYVSSKLMVNFKDITIVPESYFSKEEADQMAMSAFGSDLRMSTYTSDIAGNKKVIFRVPLSLLEIFKQRFTVKQISHAVECIKIPAIANSIDCLIYHSTIRIVLYKNSALQIIQYFEYSEPADVVYHLLNTCRQFQVDPESLQLILSGMIDETSGLYTEIYKYFLNVSLKTLPSDVQLSDDMSEHPHHFYSHLIELAQCAS